MTLHGAAAIEKCEQPTEQNEIPIEIGLNQLLKLHITKKKLKQLLLTQLFNLFLFALQLQFNLFKVIIFFIKIFHTLFMQPNHVWKLFSSCYLQHIFQLKSQTNSQHLIQQPNQ